MDLPIFPGAIQILPREGLRIVATGEAIGGAADRCVTRGKDYSSNRPGAGGGYFCLHSRCDNEIALPG
jgi:hypothetical protein